MTRDRQKYMSETEYNKLVNNMSNSSNKIFAVTFLYPEIWQKYVDRAMYFHTEIKTFTVYIVESEISDTCTFTKIYDEVNNSIDPLVISQPNTVNKILPESAIKLLEQFVCTQIKSHVFLNDGYTISSIKEIKLS